MSRSRKTLCASVIVVVILLLVAWQQGWFGEPTHNGRTVTEWLDQLLIEERQETTTGTRLVPFSPEALRNDPALLALLEIGPDAVPILVKRITDPADWPPELGRWERLKRRLHWQWNRIRGNDPGYGDSPSGYHRSQVERKSAAALTLIALGTNAQGGIPKFLDAYSAAPKHESIYGTKIPGLPVGIFPGRTVERVKEAFPELHDELVGEIRKGLAHPENWGIKAAIDAASAFPEKIDVWKEPLVLLATQHSDPTIRTEAIHKFSMAPNDSEFIRAAEAVFEDTENPPRTRTLAAIALQRAGSNAVLSLPKLRDALDDQNSDVREAASNAVQRIESKLPNP